MDAMRWAQRLNHLDIVSELEQARDDFEGFLKAHMTEEEKSNLCRREYARAFALASRVTKSSNLENVSMSEVQKRLPPGYRDLIEFFSRYPGLVKWTGIPLLLYFNAGSGDDTSSPPAAKGRRFD